MVSASLIVRAALSTGSRSSGWRTEVWAGGSSGRVVTRLVDEGCGAVEVRENGIPGDWKDGAGIAGLTAGV